MQHAHSIEYNLHLNVCGMHAADLPREAPVCFSEPSIQPHRLFNRTVYLCCQACVVFYTCHIGDNVSDGARIGQPLFEFSLAHHGHV